MADPISDEQKEFAAYLKKDFEQCFQQMRHYDSQVIDVLKFAFTAYAALIGAALTLYHYGIETKIDYRSPVIAILLIGFLMGICLVAVFTRNRVYYVIVTRYVNEHRAFFLKSKPLSFENNSEMYTDFSKPRFFHWRSTQTFFLCILTALNTALLICALVIHGYLKAGDVGWLIAVSLIAFVGQLAIPIMYLITREGQSADRAVFGID
jgi:hypothetical protein